jgi:hypothetical protein
MGEIFTYENFAKRLNAAMWERNERGDGPIDPAQCGKRLEFVRPPGTAVDVERPEFELTGPWRIPMIMVNAQANQMMFIRPIVAYEPDDLSY